MKPFLHLATFVLLINSLDVFIEMLFLASGCVVSVLVMSAEGGTGKPGSNSGLVCRIPFCTKCLLGSQEPLPFLSLSALCSKFESGWASIFCMIVKKKNSAF